MADATDPPQATRPPVTVRPEPPPPAPHRPAEGPDRDTLSTDRDWTLTALLIGLMLLLALCAAFALLAWTRAPVGATG